MLLWISLTLILFFTAWPPRAAIADETLGPGSLHISKTDWYRLEPRQYLYLRYPGTASRADRIIKCEGDWQMVPNSQGLSTAFGYAQFLNGTWLSTRQRMGLSVDLESRINPYEHIDATVWLYEADGITHWLESQGCHKIYK